MGGLAAKYGYRWVMICAMALLNLFILVVFFAPSAAVLLVGQVLCGLCWGVFATVGPAYASEVCPTKLRGYMTVYVNLCWAMGQFIAAGVLRGCLNITSDWTYRIPFAVQWAWPVPIMVICYFAPESPWYLVRHDRLEEAKRSVQRLAGDKSTEQINGTLAMIVHTTKLEAELESQQAGTSYLDCFKGTDLRRTEICCMAFAGQILSGSTFAYQPTYFFTTAGLSDNDAYSLNLGSTAIAFCGTVFSWFLITYVGRRKLYVTGQALLCGFLFLIGILNASSSSQGALWGQAAVCILWVFTYAVTVGPIAYAIVSETSSMRLRPLTVALARTSYQIVNIVSQVLQAYFMNPTAWNVNGKTGFFWGCTALLTFVWAFFRLPEAKDRTPEELDILFSNETKARQFAKTEVDAYAHAVESDRSG
jgi:SP family general alpha glucoside:H+ symporter-like MFS transporter